MCGATKTMERCHQQIGQKHPGEFMNRIGIAFFFTLLVHIFLAIFSFFQIFF